MRILCRIASEIKGKTCDLKVGVNLLAMLGILCPEICDFRINLVKLGRKLFLFFIELGKNFFRRTG